MGKFTSKNQRDWDVYLPSLMMSYRTAVHGMTGCTPSIWILGREAAVPLDLLISTQQNWWPVWVRGETTSENMYTIHKFERQHLKHETERQKRYYDHRCVRRNHFNRGRDAVWLHNPKRKKGRSRKLQNNVYKRPFLVISRLDEVTCCIQKGAKAKPTIVHNNRLKPYEGENTPAWLDSLRTCWENNYQHQEWRWQHWTPSWRCGWWSESR